MLTESFFTGRKYSRPLRTPLRQQSLRQTPRSALHPTGKKPGTPTGSSGQEYNDEVGNYAVFVAFSSLRMIEKMNSAESRQSMISTLHTIHSGMPLPHR